MIRLVLVLVAVGLVGIVGLLPLLRQETAGEAWAVGVLLAMSLAVGLFIMFAPETLNGVQVLTYLIEPLGSALFGPR